MIIDPVSNPWFSPQEFGEGTTSMGSGNGSGFFDWGNSGFSLGELSFLNQSEGFGDNASSGSVDPNKLAEWLKTSGYSLNDTPIQNFGSARYLTNPQGKRGTVQYSGVQENPEWNLGFSLASMALAPGGILTGAPGGLGGGLGLSGSSAQGVNAAFNSGMIGFGSGAKDRDVVTGMALSGGAPFLPNVGEMAGIENPYLANSFDGAVKGAAIADLTEGDVKTGGLLGGLPGLGSYLGARYMDNSYLPTSSGQNLINEANQSSMLPRRSFSLDSMANMSPIPDYVPQNSPLAFNAPRSSGGFEMPDLNEFFGKLTPSSPQGWGNLAEGLGGLLMGGMQYRKSRKLEKEMTGRRGAYETNLRRQLERKDAASGRRSNYGGRETALQASLAELDSRNMPAMFALNDSQMRGLAGMFTSGLRYAGKQGVFGEQYMPGYREPSQTPINSYLMSTIPMTSDVSNFDQFIGGTKFGDQNQRRFKLGGM
jgi:hypothetical protein